MYNSTGLTTLTATLKNNLITISTPTETWQLKRPGSLEELWDNMTESEHTIPYWAELWPASLVLGEWLTKQRKIIADKACIDAGCGLGFTTLLAKKLGAQVTGMDYCRDALYWCGINASLNKISQINWVCGDWDQNPFKKGVANFIWASDIAYEKDFFAPLLAFFEWCLSPDGKIWIAEPGRTIFYIFLRMAKGWKCAPVFTAKAEAIYGSEPAKTVRIWEMTRKPNHIQAQSGNSVVSHYAC